MKYKIKDTREFVDKDGLTNYEVTIQAPIGIFSGISVLDKEDEPNKSRFLGYEIAEKKAVRKMYKKYIANAKIELKVYDDLDDKGYDDEYIYSQIQRVKQKIRDAEYQIQIIEFSIYAAIASNTIINGLGFLKDKKLDKTVKS